MDLRSYSSVQFLPVMSKYCCLRCAGMTHSQWRSWVQGSGGYSSMINLQAPSLPTHPVEYLRKMADQKNSVDCYNVVFARLGLLGFT